MIGKEIGKESFLTCVFDEKIQCICVYGLQTLELGPFVLATFMH